MMNNGKTLAVIPARGGSKGIPRKNVLPLGGIPLIGHAIRAALAARTVDIACVSTDDPEIAGVARQFGAEVVIRPDELATDQASSEAALLHAISEYKNRGVLLDTLVFLQCTSPLVSAEDIDGTASLVISGAADTAFSAVPFHYFVWEKVDGAAIGINHDKRVRQRRQDRAPQYLETGAVYAMKCAEFETIGHRFFGHTAIHEVPAERQLEIDEPSDFVLAELRMASLGAK